jgi:hypothetical protein
MTKRSCILRASIAATAAVKTGAERLQEFRQRWKSESLGGFRYEQIGHLFIERC